MTTITDFDIATDLKVEFFLAGGGENIFIIGISKIGSASVLSYGDVFTVGLSLLGGIDVLGESAFRWTNLNCVTTDARLAIGGSVVDQLYFQPQPAQASITLQSLNFDPNYFAPLTAGTRVRVRLDNGTVDEVIWSGVVNTIGISYDQDGNNLLQINALDNFNRVVNTRLDTFDSTTGFPGFVTPYEQLELIATGFGSSMSALSVEGTGKIPSRNETDVIPSSLIYEAIQSGLGLFWIDPATEQFVFVPRPESITPSAGTPVIGNDHSSPNHLCMTAISASVTEDTVYNSLKVTLASDESISTLRENIDSIALFGKYAKDVSLNTTDLDELNLWADLVFQQYPSSLVDSVETATRDRLGNLTEAAFFTPGQLVGVKYDEGVVAIDDYFAITKVSHSITVDNWLTTLEVWKEA